MTKDKKDVSQRIHIRLTKKQYAKLQKLAAEGGFSISETLRRAADFYIGYQAANHL